ncbi:MAG TPA: hypothetical protein VFX42_00085, partial [Gemmatimonadales bacterium]|nr:hypothetical protein [Gemmatimonadales bacterium]
MPQGRLARFVFAAFAPLAFAGCSGSSPLAPDNVQYATVLAQPAEGTMYLLTVYATTVGRGVVLDAYVEDASRNPATSGTAVFQMCSLQGIPAPSTDCNSGSGRWVRVGMAGI